jgi:hypothetical protein
MDMFLSYLLVRQIRVSIMIQMVINPLPLQWRFFFFDIVKRNLQLKILHFSLCLIYDMKCRYSQTESSNNKVRFSTAASFQGQQKQGYVSCERQNAICKWILISRSSNQFLIWGSLLTACWCHSGFYSILYMKLSANFTVVTMTLFATANFSWVVYRCCWCVSYLFEPLLTHWVSLQFVLFTSSGNRPDSMRVWLVKKGCDPSTGDAYSS